MNLEHLAMNAELFMHDIPKNLKEAKQRNNYKCWKDVVSKEMAPSERNNTWSLINQPENVSLIDSKWVFRIKKDQIGNVQKYKAAVQQQYSSDPFFSCESHEKSEVRI